MPIYDYKCLECGKIIHTKHSMKEKPSICSQISSCENESGIEKIVSLSLSTSSGKDVKSSQNALAERVERHIEHLREESRQTKAETRNKTFSQNQALKISKGK